MSDEKQKSSEGMPKSGNAMLIRAAVIGAVALVIALWAGGAFDTDGPPLSSFGIMLAGLASFLMGAATSVMAENVIEDLVKMCFAAIPWLLLHLTGIQGAPELIALGLLIGSAVGFLGNRLTEPKRSHS